MGAAGRDFHNFNMFFRNNPDYEVVAFTATQIPYISDRKYPKELSGKLYPNGIPIYPEEELPELIRKHNVDEVFFSYSDVTHEYVMHKASLVLSCGASFVLLGQKFSEIKSKKPVISVCAVRTGSGKSPASRRVAKILRKMEKRVVIIRHPMPYGDLRKQISQRFETYEDLDKHECTIEEREDYEPHLDNGFIVYAGVDYEEILKEAEKEADIILWDGGNNDTSFYKSDLYIVVADARRPDHEITYHPGETNLREADVVIINKVEYARKEDIEDIEKNIKENNPDAKIILSKLTISPDKPGMIKGKNVLVIEDGPTLTHGGLPTGAAYLAAEKYGAKQIIDPRKFAVGSIKIIFKKFYHLDRVLPAMGYSREQIKELEKTINACDCDLVLIGTPTDISRILNINKPAIRVRYELEEIGKPNLEDIMKDFVKKL